MLCGSWWPHPTHGSITIIQHDHLLVFQCSCGDSFGMPAVIARGFGMIE